MIARRRRTAVLVSLLLVLNGSVDTGARAQAIPSLGETIEVAIVNVDVVVTDKSGKRVHALTRDDFEIYEDGKVQPLSHFAEYRGESRSTALSPEAAATLAEQSAEPPAGNQPSQRRTLIIFIELFKLPNFRVDPFIDSIKDLVRNTIRSGDSVSLVTFEGSADMRVAATGDVALIERELDQIGLECKGPVRDKLTIPASTAEQVRAFEAELAARAEAMGIAVAGPSETDIAIHAARIQAVEARVEMNRRVATINTLLHGMAGIEGKKLLLLASHRLGEYVGAEYYYAAGIPDAVIPAVERNEIDNRQAIRTIIANANASGVTIYPVFPTGLDYTPADPSVPDVARSVLMNEMVTLREIADKTGGVTTYGTTNTAKLMPDVAEDVNNYYSLAYRATARLDDSARKIVVKMKNPALHARARREFVEKSNESRMRDRVLAALHDAPVDTSFELEAELGSIRKVGRKTQTAPLKVRIPISGLTLLPQDGKHLGAFTVYAITGGTLGEVSEVTRRVQSFDVPASDLERALAGYFTYNFDVIVDERTRHIAVGVIDEVSKTFGLINVPVGSTQ
ncbi:MAG: VWA domain-containing protein [Acidobacteriota bacterium]|nr:VWA domain-containing protein [Acidobacteriota bacterium]